MRTITLGQSTMQASRLAYGCWRITGSPETGRTTPEHDAQGKKAVQAAFESGFTLFDLADIYAESEAERLFGQALREHPGMRQSILIATKCGIRRKGDPTPDSPYRYDFSADYIVRSCEGSLKRMGIESIDLYQLHRPDFLGAPEEIASAFSRLHQAGKARGFGVSNFRPSQVLALQKACPMPLLVNQVEISLSHIEPLLDGTLDQCLAERMTPMAWSPLAAGRLVEAAPIDLQTPDHAHRIHVREIMDLIARDRGVSRTVIALAWLLKHPAGVLPIVGTTQPERIRDAAKAADLDLTRDEWYRLMEAAYGRRLP